MMNVECSNLLKSFLLIGTISILFNPIAVSAQQAVTLPCYSVEKAPEYLYPFLQWVKKQDAVELKVKAKAEDVLATISFKSFHLKKLYDRLYAPNQDYVTGNVNGVLKIMGSCQAPAFTGTISISDGYVQLTNFGRQALQHISIDATEEERLVNRFDSLRVDMNISIDNSYSLHNNQFLPMKIKIKGILHLKKQINRNSKLTGKLSIIEGFVKPLGTRFQVVGGQLIYKGEIDNPQINLSSLYIPHHGKQDVKIWYVIEGTIEDPSFKFRSEPVMELRNILSYTLFGQAFYRLDSVEQGLISSIAGRSAADHTADVLMNRVEAIATEKLSVDVVRVDNTTAESGTVITTGWYLNPKVFFAIQNVIAGRPKIGFYLEYYLTENLKLILSQDNDYGQGIDLQYEYNY